MLDVSVGDTTLTEEDLKNKKVKVYSEHGMPTINFIIYTCNYFKNVDAKSY